MPGWPYTTQRWKRLRLAKLHAQPLCQQCERDGMFIIASVVDHVQPIKHGGAPFPGLDGLASLCPACHSAKTARGVEAGAAKTDRPRIRKGCTATGKPIDPNHPWSGKSLRAEALETAPINRRQLVPKQDYSGGANG